MNEEEFEQGEDDDIEFGKVTFSRVMCLSSKTPYKDIYFQVYKMFRAYLIKYFQKAVKNLLTNFRLIILLILIKSQDELGDRNELQKKDLIF